MSNTGDYAGISNIAQVRSGAVEACSACNSSLDATEDFAGAVNHYLGHGYMLLHVGQQTSKTEEGVWTETVAILGRS